MKTVTGLALAALLALLSACASLPPGEPSATSATSTLAKRPFRPTLSGKWIGNGISYGAYRDGESPGDLTSKANILEDLRIISARWNLIRLYGSGRQSRNILEVIRDNGLPIRVMQGAWLSSQQTPAENREQVEGAIDLANRFADIVVAVNVGNEIFVDWSWHRMGDMDEVIGYIREVRARVRQPVTVADDYNFWNKKHAYRIAAEIDFIGLHAYAFWNDKTIDEAMSWTRSIYGDIQQRHPQHLVAYTETGWPTSRVYGGGSYEGGLVGKAGEDQQKLFFDEYNSWVDNKRVVSFYFEAFDEKWKGGFDGQDPMSKAEKHWGLYSSDRRPKKALR